MTDALSPGNIRGTADAAHLDTTAEGIRVAMLNNISWGAVLAGVVMTLVVQLLLNLLGIGIGAATFDPGTDDNPSMTSFSVGAGVWWTIAGILASFAGAYAAGRLSGKPSANTGGWHGLATWALTTLVIFYLLSTTMGGVLGGAFNTLSGAIGGIGRTAGGAVQTAAQAAAPALAQVTDPFSDIERSIRSASAGQDPAALREAAVSAMRAAATGDQGQAQVARDRAADAVAKAQNISVDDAKQQVQRYEQQYRQAVEEAKQQVTAAADATAKAVSRGALFGFVALLLGAIVSWYGGRVGTVDPTLEASRAT